METLFIKPYLKILVGDYLLQSKNACIMKGEPNVTNDDSLINYQIKNYDIIYKTLI